jgi:hypothetical protein
MPNDRREWYLKWQCLTLDEDGSFSREAIALAAGRRDALLAYGRTQWRVEMIDTPGNVALQAWRTYRLKYVGHAVRDAEAYERERVDLGKVEGLSSRQPIAKTDSLSHASIADEAADKNGLYDVLQRAGPMIDAALSD